MTARRTAVVTGASSGLGAGIAQALAARDHDVVLVARRADRLEALADELRTAHGVAAHVVAVDLADPAGPARVAEAVADLGPDVLVNAAGFGTAENLVDEDPARIAEEVDVNVRALTVLTRLLLPSLLASPAGLLVNVSSTASFQPVPGLAVYAATKAYVTSLTEAVWAETRGTALTVVCLCPGPADTEFFQVAGTERFKVGQVVTVEQVVDVAMRAARGRGPLPTAVVGWRNRVTSVLTPRLPRRLVLTVTARLTGATERREAPVTVAAGAGEQAP